MSNKNTLEEYNCLYWCFYFLFNIVEMKYGQLHKCIVDSAKAFLALFSCGYLIPGNTWMNI